jgi:hypothetical protein
MPASIRRIKNTFTNIANFFFSLRCQLSIAEYWGLLFFACISLFVPKLWFAIFGYILFKTSRVEMRLNPLPVELPNIVLHIQMNHIDSLTKAIESNPELLYLQYKRQSLLAWCQYYKNPRAQSVIIQLMAKHPQSLSVAA